jgi:hypothetical protein
MILDTGVDPEVISLESRSFVATPAIRNHGTRVFKIIAGDEGIAPACDVCVAEVIGSGTHGAVAGALGWALEIGVDVINMSFACPSSDADADRAIDELSRRGVLLIAAYNRWLHWPHSHDAVIAVGGEGEAHCPITGPKEYPVRVSGQTEIFTGSSAAAAVLSGIAACAKAFDRSMSRERFLQQLQIDQALRR